MSKISTPLGITIIIVIAFIIGGGVLAYQYWWLPKQEETLQENPSIKVISPNGGEVWTKGQKIEILWTTTEGIKYVNIRMGILGDPNSQSFNAAIASKVPNNGSYEWTVQELYAEVWGTKALPVSDKYFITVEDNEHSNVYDSSDAAFSIVAASVCGGIQGIICPTGYECIYSGGSKFSPYPDATGTCAPISAKPFITVLSPNGGETWEIGKSYTILWKTTGLGSDTQVSIILEGVGTAGPREGEAYRLIANVSNTGRYNWTVPVDIFKTPNNTYKILIYNYENSDIQDRSNAPFSIK